MTNPGRFRKRDKRTREMAREGARATNEARRKRKAERARTPQIVLDRLAGESFHVFWGKRLGFHTPSRKVWSVIAKVISCIPLTDDEWETYGAITGRRTTVPMNLREVWIIAGRSSGKSEFAGAFAAYKASRKYPTLSRGEAARIRCFASDREQAGIVHDYFVGNMDGDEELHRLVSRRRAGAFTTAHGVKVQIGTASFRKVRGPSYAAVVADECCYWWSDSESKNPDTEIFRGIKPGLRLPDSLLLSISSPYARKGVAWETYEKHFGKEHDRILVVQAPTWVFNPEFDRDLIDEAYEDDPQAAAAEYGAEFRKDVEQFLSIEVVRHCTVAGRHELPPQYDVRYYGFTDPSGGSKDSFTLYVAHREGETAVVDCVRETRPPFSPDVVCAEYAAVLKRYGVRKVTGDRYAGVWPTERFAAHGITYEQAVRSKSEIYLEALPLLNGGRARLLDDKRLAQQLVALERRTGRSGKDSIAEPPNGHDDVCNSVCGALVIAVPSAPMGKKHLVATPDGGFYQCKCVDGRHLHGQLRAPEPTKAEREGAAIADMIAEANRRREAELDLIYGRADDYDPRHYSVRVGKGATKETRRVLREMERS